MWIERSGLPRSPCGHLHPCRLAARVDPAGAAPSILNVIGMRHGPGRRPLRFEPPLEFLAQVVGQTGDLDAGGHLPRALHHVDHQSLAALAMLDAGGCLRRGKAFPPEGECRLVGDGSEEGLPARQRTAEQQEFVVGHERPRKPLGVELREAADHDPIRMKQRGGCSGRFGSRHGRRQQDRKEAAGCGQAGGAKHRSGTGHCKNPKWVAAVQPACRCRPAAARLTS